ncbi:(S)-8-oxocitronellyl enol synthase CYC2 [Impatiens glandulifera]|uniref:(S)-8-oxocitronellyl enol synthase CYC2 n=1 Tax=Impatiens glandulifera TaxID=253017 RepID=UPI001FB154F3|nr:(S)-8-oxocitronellyl enol synthase CYC2 [Impatiens glandulifera]
MTIDKCNGLLGSVQLMENVAIIFGVTGLVGKELAKKLLSEPGWKVYGIARRPEAIPAAVQNPKKYNFISCDLLNPTETHQKLNSHLDPQYVTHMFWVTWAGQHPLDTKECYEQNKAMMANALNAILPRAKSLKHFSLQTGTKHYVSLQAPFNSKSPRFFSEDIHRARPVQYNFYYALEDLLREKLAGKVSWSVHRPGLIMGSSRRTLFNVMGTLCVYGTICKYLNMPFLFGGTRDCWEEMFIDGSDAQLVAKQHVWAATSDHEYSGQGQAFNAINGESFSWKKAWPSIGMKFGVEVTRMENFSEEFTFAAAMADMGRVWKEIVKREGLVETEIGDLANWEFMDCLFRCPVKMLGTREKADRMGFRTRCDTTESILYWIEIMRKEKLIP